jgi:DNA-binding response OmpR family regulator
MPSAKRRVLVVDDEPQVATMLRFLLTAWGYTVQVAGTGPEAISEVPEFCPDVVLLDMALPGIPGELVLDCLHAADAHLPIVMMTARSHREVAQSVQARGAYDFIAKPFDLARLRLVVKAALTFQH